MRRLFDVHRFRVSREACIVSGYGDPRLDYCEVYNAELHETWNANLVIITGKVDLYASWWLASGPVPDNWPHRMLERKWYNPLRYVAGLTTRVPLEGFQQVGQTTVSLIVPTCHVSADYSGLL